MQNVMDDFFAWGWEIEGERIGHRDRERHRQQQQTELHIVVRSVGELRTEIVGNFQVSKCVSVKQTLGQAIIVSFV